MGENIIQNKSFAFAVRIVKLTRYLSGDRNEKIISNQILRSGTSIGANIEEAISGQSRRDFIHKLQIARKETRETLYWVKLLAATGTLDEKQASSILSDANELLAILTSIIISSSDKIKEQEAQYGPELSKSAESGLELSQSVEPFQSVGYGLEAPRSVEAPRNVESSRNVEPSRKSIVPDVEPSRRAEYGAERSQNAEYGSEPSQNADYGLDANYGLDADYSLKSSKHFVDYNKITSKPMQTDSDTSP